MYIKDQMVLLKGLWRRPSVVTLNSKLQIARQYQLNTNPIVKTDILSSYYGTSTIHTIDQDRPIVRVVLTGLPSINPPELPRVGRQVYPVGLLTSIGNVPSWYSDYSYSTTSLVRLTNNTIWHLQTPLLKERLRPAGPRQGPPPEDPPTSLNP